MSRGVRPPFRLLLLGVGAMLLPSLGCERHDVDVELPTSGRALSRAEETEVRRISEAAFRDVRTTLAGLPPRLTLIVRWGKDVIRETGESGAAGFPGNLSLTLDPDRDVLATIRNQVRATLIHELHHLARASHTQTQSSTLVDRVVTEGLATAFERDFGKTDPPWGRLPPEIMDWTHEVLRQPETAEPGPWLYRHPDGRRWIGIRVGTFLVDRASRASGKSAAELVFAPTSEIVRLAEVP